MAKATQDAQTKYQLATAFKNQFDPFRSENLFVGIGKISLGETRTGDGERTDVKDESTRKNILFTQIIQDTDVSYVVPRVDWTENTVYDQYDPSSDMSTKNFYVYNDKSGVDALYVCVEAPSSASLKAPQTLSNVPEDTGDGYKWRFVSRVTGDIRKFLDTDYVPIKVIPTYTLPSGEGVVVGDDLRQYSSQLKAKSNEQNGEIQRITVTQGGTPAVYSRSIFAGYRQEIRTSLATSTQLDDEASSVDDYYNGYALVFTTGKRAGQIVEITDYDGTSRVATHASISVNADPGDFYEVKPLITITGDGTGAVAIGECNSDGVLTEVYVANTGSGYESATATVSTTKDGGTDVPTLTPIIFDDRGEDPSFELFASSVKIVAEIPPYAASSNTSPKDNDYTEIFLASQFLVGTGPSDQGKPAGHDADVTTKVRLETISGGEIGVGTIALDDIVYGETSKAFSQVDTLANSPDDSNVLVGLKGVGGVIGDYEAGEIVQVITSTGTTLASRGRTLKVEKSYTPSTIITFPKQYFRGTHKVGVTFSAEPVFNTAITGASGSVGLIASVVDVEGNDSTNSGATLFLTQVFDSVTSGTLDFTVGETITTSVGQATVKTIEGPEINLNSGKMLYIEGITAVERDDEQQDTIELLFDF